MWTFFPPYVRKMLFIALSPRQRRICGWVNGNIWTLLCLRLHSTPPSRWKIFWFFPKTIFDTTKILPCWRSFFFVSVCLPPKSGREIENSFHHRSQQTSSEICGCYNTHPAEHRKQFHDSSTCAKDVSKLLCSAEQITMRKEEYSALSCFNLNFYGEL